MSGIGALPLHLQHRLKAELADGESLIWAGQPNATRMMKHAFKSWFILVPWTAMFVFLLYKTVTPAVSPWSGSRGWPIVIILTCLLGGIVNLFSPWMARSLARSTIYAITNRRALTIAGIRSITVQSFLPADLAGMTKVLGAGGSGDLVLRIEHYRDGDGDERTREQGFLSVDDVLHVKRLLVDLMRGTQSMAAPRF